MTQAEINTKNNETFLEIGTDIKSLKSGKENVRPKREINNATQHTIVASDFDYELDFTNTGTGTLNLILNDGVAPAGKRLYFISTGNKQIKFVSGTGVTFLFPEGATDTIGIRGWGGLVPATASKTFSVNGTLIASATGGDSNVQADIDQTDITADDFIQNKHSIPNFVPVVTKSEAGKMFPPNLGSAGGTFVSTITSPQSGDSFTEGQIINVTVDLGTEAQFVSTITEPQSGDAYTQGDTIVVVVDIPEGLDVGQGAYVPYYDADIDEFDWKKEPQPLVGRNLTGSVIDLSNVVGNTYNYSTPAATNGYTFTKPVVNGFARCFVNRGTEPSVLNANKVKGAEFIPNTTMEMVVESPNGINAEYYFVER